ncbi:unnamed protein product [Anisakis simplex]|uniref:Secreted protein n=1 Tax=Anisakis simplex TaxID=6269 RepID=A0A0M3JZK8_ANISI|nr:unnamed protein product [Anisakis simplex]
MSFNFLSVPFLVTVIAAAQFNHDNSAENGQYAGRAASYNNATTDSPDLPTAVEVRIKLKSYLDQGLRLPNGMTCVCPSGFQCSYLGTVEPRCFMAFSVMVSPPRGSIQYMTTEFLPLTDSGALDLSRVTNEQANQWSQPHVFHLNGKPAAISVFVHHMGVEINAQTGALAQMQSVVHVDTFVQDLQQVLPTTASKNDDHSVTLTGQVIQTQLSLSYSVKCAGDALGMNCDLQCNQSSVQSDIALCRSIDTGFLYTCSYTDNNLQVRFHNCCQHFRRILR